MQAADINFVPSSTLAISKTPLETAKLLDRQKIAEILMNTE